MCDLSEIFSDLNAFFVCSVGGVLSAVFMVLIPVDCAMLDDQTD